MRATYGLNSSGHAAGNSTMTATMNLSKPVGGDLTMTKNLDRASLRNAMNLVPHEDTNKVFYNTGGFQLKNSLSKGPRT